MNKFVIDNLLTRLSGDDGKQKNKYIKNLPNAKSYKIVIQGKEIPLIKMGIRKSVKSHWEIIRFKNRRANRYIEYMINRLGRNVTRPIMFWRIVSKLIFRSSVWYVIHLNKVFPGWYRWIPYYLVAPLCSKVRKEAAEFSGNVDHRRVYIPKTTQALKEWLRNPDRTWRPLGVPTPTWRIYLSMLNTALTIWLERTWNPEQHGYFPRKGTFTAWVSIFKLIDSPTIFEFDLKSFFPSVQIGYVSRMLTKTNMPKAWVEYFENLNRSQPKLTEEDLVDESKVRENIDIAKGILNKQQTWYGPVQDFVDANGKELWQELVMEDTGGFSIHHEYEFVQTQWALFSSIAEATGKHSHIGTTRPAGTGLPQGGGISPVLSVIVLDELFKKNKAVMYADDGIIFGEPILQCPEYEMAGIKFNEEKSSYVKKDGIWLKPLKFLGLIYDGNKDTLSSKTYKGKELLISRSKIGRLVNASEWYTSEGRKKDGNIWLEALASRLGGFIQAMYYNGTYDLSSKWNGWKVKSSHSSWYKSRAAKWARKNYKYKTNLYNSSTLASYWLLNKLRLARIKHGQPKKVGAIPTPRALKNVVLENKSEKFSLTGSKLQSLFRLDALLKAGDK